MAGRVLATRKIDERRDDVVILAAGLNTSVWARVTARDEVEVALNANPEGKPRGNGQSFLYLSPDGRWRTQGLHLLEGASPDGAGLSEGDFGLDAREIERADPDEIAAAIADSLSNVEFIVNKSIQTGKFGHVYSTRLKSIVRTLRQMQEYVHKNVELPLFRGDDPQREAV